MPLVMPRFLGFVAVLKVPVLGFVSKVLNERVEMATEAAVPGWSSVRHPSLRK
jgi:hypothetical protein